MTSQSTYEPGDGDTIKSRYRLQSELGEGGFARAYLARDTHRGQDVVVKHPLYSQFSTGGNPDSLVREKFELEIELLEKIRDAGGHPHVMGLEDSFAYKGIEFSVVEYIDGEILEDIDEDFSAEQVRSMGVELCKILEFLHGLEIIYRDMKPDNVMRDSRGNITLIDLNAAKDVGAVETLDHTSFRGNQPFYPPEMAQSSHVTNPIPLGPHSDVYAAGKFIFWLLVGSAPREDAKAPSELGADAPQYLDEIIERATRSDPDDRYNNATILRRALEEKNPNPSKRARIEWVQKPGRTFDVNPGDTIGRKEKNTAAITIRDPKKYISAVQAKFDTDRNGSWFLEDRSTNGTFINKHNSWDRILSDEGYRRLKRENQAPPTNPPTRMNIEDGDIIALVHPQEDFYFEFHES